jgi:hypothetical protein
MLRQNNKEAMNQQRDLWRVYAVTIIVLVAIAVLVWIGVMPLYSD